MQWFKNISLVLSTVVFFSACTNDAKKLPPDTPSTGTIDISADETYQPIIEEQIKVFDSSFPEAHINVHYKPEGECIKDFMEDKARLILVTRELSADEKKVLEQKKVVSTSLAVAKDAVAVVVNNDCEDSILSVSQLKGILTETYKKKYAVVFDNQGSSTLRYIMDSILRGEKLGPNAFAAKGNDSVLAYIEKNPNAIGFVGISRVSDFSDPEGLAFIKNVKVAALFNEKQGKVYKPYQAYIAPNWYPLTRNLYYIHRETFQGLGSGFANFLTKERGQLIFKQARLFPLRSNIIFREAAVNP